MNAREAAYLALLASLREEQFIMASLSLWQQQDHPAPQDFALAHEIATGAARMALALDYIAQRLTTTNKLNLKLKERALLRTAIYQACFMDKVPLYAIVNESVDLAKKYCYHTFIAFLNATLRKLEPGLPSLPEGDSVEALSVRFSYPQYFVTEMLKDYGLEATKAVLTYGNTPAKTMVRVRPGVDINAEAFKFLNPLKEAGVPAAIVGKTTSLAAISALPEIYIQNATSVALISDLAAKTPPPESLLDLCASPGGKLLAAHDLYPQARLYANDISVEKIMRLSQNLAKYGVKADLACGLGEEYQDATDLDLIILDVPCSNSGVLNKRAEARWRLSAEALAELHKKQYGLMRHAVELLKENGKMWFITCSILKSENEAMIAKATAEFGLKVEFTRTILPTSEGWDGGFGALLSKS